MTSSEHDAPAVGDVVLARPEVLAKHQRLTSAYYVVAQIHDFRADSDPALYLTLVEEPVYRHYMDREGGRIAEWSPWHVVVDPSEVQPVGPVAVEIARHGQYALFDPAA